MHTLLFCGSAGGCLPPPNTVPTLRPHQGTPGDSTPPPPPPVTFKILI